MTTTNVREFTPADWNAWLRMACALFPEEPLPELEVGMREFIARADATVFLAERADGSECGFVEVGSRSYADGCYSSPVGYIEAWYTDSDVRAQGVGRALLSAAESWARGMGYTEMASDALLDNTVSHAAHGRCGYEQVNRVVQFRKAL